MNSRWQLSKLMDSMMPQQLYIMPSITIAPLLLLLLLLVVLVSTLPCPAYFPNNGLASGIISLVPTTQGQSSFSYTFPQSFNALPQVVVGICAFSTPQSTSNNGNSFYALPSASAYRMQVTSRSQSQGWSIVRVTFLASANPEMLLDTLSTQLYATGNNQQTVTFKLNSKNSIVLSKEVIVRTFLSGISSVAPVLLVELQTATLSGLQLTMGVSIQLSATAQVWVGVVAFSSQAASFSSYGGTALVGQKGDSSVDLLQTFTAVQVAFYGVSMMQISTVQSNLLDAEIGSDFMLRMKLEGESSFKVSYIFLGQLPQGMCSKCGGNIYYEGQCLDVCPTNTTLVKLTNQAELCRKGQQASINQSTQQASSSTQATAQQTSTQQTPSSTQATAQQTSTQQTPSSQTTQQTSTTTTSQSSTQQSSTMVNGSAGGGILGLSSMSSSAICPLPNMYWNGFECLCKVGFSLISNLCIQTVLTPTTPITTICQGSHQYSNGTACLCYSPYLMVNSTCTSQCKQGQTILNGICKSASCPAASKDNGLGVCVCTSSNYQMVNNSCQLASCGSNQYFNGSDCICDSQRLQLAANGTCQPVCTSGQLWLNQTCVVVCDINMAYDQVSRQCECIPGFARGSTAGCQLCLNNFQAVNGYCVTCPLHSTFSGGVCQCQTGYIRRLGVCSLICQSLQILNPSTGSCECQSGLVLTKGVCSPCPSNYYIVNGSCSNCPLNAIYSNGNCLCQTGYILNSINQCVVCSSMANTYLLNNYCVQCPQSMAYNQVTQQCQCPTGSTAEGGRCVQTCSQDQLTDSNGTCYSCPLHMSPQNGVCVCWGGYVLYATGCGCVLSCNSHQFPYLGTCAQCPLNTVYSAQLQGCVCPTGTYRSYLYNTCLKSPVLPQTCSLGQYYNNSTIQCLSCPSNCYNCTQNQCLQCQTGYQLSPNAICQTVCGDGLILDHQQCDSGSIYQPDCIACRIQTGYTCSGQPSVCTATTPSQPDPPAATDSLAMIGTASINTNNIFITLTTVPTFTFPNVSDMQDFIQITFSNNWRPTSYCLQQSAELARFDCLLVYPSGVPNSQFTVNMRFNYQGHSAFTNITVDPFAVLNTRGRIL